MDQTVGVDCVGCGNSYPIELADVVDLGAEPLLRRRLMRGTLNYALCPHCGTHGPVDHAFLILDPVAGRTIFYVPEGGENPTVAAAILRNVLSIYQQDDPQPYYANQVQVGDWGDLVALLADGAVA